MFLSAGDRPTPQRILASASAANCATEVTSTAGSRIGPISMQARALLLLYMLTADGHAQQLADIFQMTSIDLASLF